MSDEVPTWEPEADPFAESDEWIAAQVRQVFRARRSGDAKAAEVELTYLDHYFTVTIHRLLLRQDPDWQGRRGFFDGLTVRPEFPSAGILRLSGEICWMADTGACSFDPFEAEIELCPRTGALRWYVARFGDHRPLAAKTEQRGAEAGPPVGGWAYTVERRAAEPRAAANPRRQLGSGGA
jgi:hypothetical protein